LANKIESFKKPIASNTNTIDTNGKASSGGDIAVSTSTGKVSKGNVLGTSTGPVYKSGVEDGGNKQMDSVFNICMDLLAFLVRGWKYTLGGIVLLFLILKVTGWRKK
jgi:hypothetical protein